MPYRSEELLEAALRFKRFADTVRDRDPEAARRLDNLAARYLELAEAAQRQETAGKPILGR